MVGFRRLRDAVVAVTTFPISPHPHSLVTLVVSLFFIFERRKQLAGQGIRAFVIKASQGDMPPPMVSKETTLQRSQMSSMSKASYRASAVNNI
jgi:hypothetical protein